MGGSRLDVWQRRANRFAGRGVRGWGRDLAATEWQAAAGLWRRIESELDGWVADLGAGNGGFWRLVARPQKLVVIDLAAIPLLITPRPEALRADAARLPLADESLAGIIALGLVEYLDDLPGVFQEWRRAALGGGFLIVTNSPPILPNIARRVFGFGARPRPDVAVANSLQESGWEVVDKSPRRGWQTAFLARAV